MQFSVVSVFALLAAAVSAAPANSLYEDALAQVESAFPTVDSAVQTVAAQGYAEALSILNLDLSNATSVVSSLVRPLRRWRFKGSLQQAN